jgi:2-keto-4-pentenoate hydratase/2-oxohepta-3-ene-1,7-dioic acid hydratase in catechol pathway
MRLVSFQIDSKSSWGVVINSAVFDLSKKFEQRFPTLLSTLDSDALEQIAQYVEGSSPDFGLDEITFRPVIPNPEKILCVGVNYEMHRMETGRDKSPYPVIFTRFANTQVGHQQPIVKPKVSDQLDYEGELAVIIGKGGRYIQPEDALSHVAGYACYNDATLRDWQRHTHQFTPGKNFPATGGFGPWMVTADEIPDPTELTLVTRLNGVEMQQASTNQLIFKIPELITYISTFTRLEPGDVIATGTPGGVGSRRNPPVFMKAGDIIEVEISRIGTLRNTVVND